jgi:putative oxidoreductase
MKVIVLIARILLGLVFVVFGFNKIVPFMPATIPPGDAGAMMGLMVAHKWLTFYGCVETAGGLMLLTGRFVPLGLTLLAGMITNIMLFNITLFPSAVPMGVAVGVFEAFLVWAYRSSFAGIFAAKAQPEFAKDAVSRGEGSRASFDGGDKTAYPRG